MSKLGGTALSRNNGMREPDTGLENAASDQDGGDRGAGPRAERMRLQRS